MNFDTAKKWLIVFVFFFIQTVAMEYIYHLYNPEIGFIEVL